MRNPSYFFDASPERALINPDNLHILVDHVKCAAFELPFTTVEEFGRHDVQEVLGVLEESGFVHRAAARRRAPDGDEASGSGRTSRIPADAVSLRSISSDNFVVVDTTHGADVIGETELHERAVDAAREGDLHRRGQRCIRWRGSISRGARRTCGRSTATTTPTRSRTRR